MRRTKIQIEKDNRTYCNLQYAFKKHGIEAVRKAVYGELQPHFGELIAMYNWVNTRTYREDIQARIEQLSN